MATKCDWLLYGANGYTGRLIAEEAPRRGMRPVLAGRNAREIENLARRLDLPFRVFALDESGGVADQLSGMTAVLNCAGPFSRTAPALMEACLTARAHYLDITGEIEVIEAAAALDRRAREAGVGLLPAVGFDVAPSDCLAAMLADQLPAATHLRLAFTATGGVSPGTAKTMLQVMPTGGRARIDGEIRRVPHDWKKRDITFPSGVKQAVTIPWGDVASAYYSTGIANIETYLAATPALARQSHLLRSFAGLLRSRLVGKLAETCVGWTIAGPSAARRAATRAELWGQVSDAAGNTVEAALETPDGYTLTVLSALAALERVLRDGLAPGFTTPSKAFGKEFILSLPDVRLVDGSIGTEARLRAL
ncbi:MAG TPA: saccharopine dehydrogenase NADP-binding domain-containing protein [Pirellulales bacterium]